jgi:hypothetical protein
MPTIPPNQSTIYQFGGVSLQSMYVGMGIESHSIETKFG